MAPKEMDEPGLHREMVKIVSEVGLISQDPRFGIDTARHKYVLESGSALTKCFGSGV